MAAAHGMQTAAAESAVDAGHAVVGQAGDTGEQQRAAPAGRSGADASVVDRGDGRRSADLLTQRHNHINSPDVNGRDKSTDPPGRPHKLGRASTTDDTSRRDDPSVVGARLTDSDASARPPDRPGEAVSPVPPHPGADAPDDAHGQDGSHEGVPAESPADGSSGEHGRVEPTGEEEIGTITSPGGGPAVELSVEQRLTVQAHEALTDWRARRGMDPPRGWPTDEPWPPPDVADLPRWADVDHEGLIQVLVSEDFKERLGASIEVVYRETGMIPRREQLMTAIGLYEGSSTELGPGGGKTVAGGMALAWRALDEGKASMFAHVRYLADEAHDQFKATWSKYRITAVRWSAHGEHPNPDGPTAYFCTDAEDAHASQAGHDTGSRTWIFDEVHRMNPDRTYSTVHGGDDHLAPAADRAMVTAANDLVEKHLTEDDVIKSGPRKGTALLRKESLPKVRDALHAELSQQSRQDAVDAAVAERDSALANDRAALREAAADDPRVQAAQTRLEDAYKALATAERDGEPVEDAQEAVVASQAVKDAMMQGAIDKRITQLDKAVEDTQANLTQMREALGTFLDEKSTDGLSTDGLRHLNAAITARFDYDRNRYFVSDDNKIVLISQDTGDPEADKATGTHSHLPRDIDLALKAKEGLRLTEVPHDAVRTSAEEHFGPQSGRADHRVGMTGTGDRYPKVAERLGRLGFAEMAEIPDHFEPLLFEHPDTNGWPENPDRPWDVEAKLNYMLDQAIKDHDGFRPVLLVLPNEIELLRMVEMHGRPGHRPRQHRRRPAGL